MKNMKKHVGVFFTTYAISQLALIPLGIVYGFQAYAVANAAVITPLLGVLVLHAMYE